MKNDILNIIQTYNSVVKVIDGDAKNQSDRSYGGLIRATKGKLQEYITEEIIRIAWKSIGGKSERLDINSNKIHIPIQKLYIENIKDKNVKKHILDNIQNYYYGLSVDKQVFVDNKFVIGVECKAYTENAMIKRILTDFSLLKTIYPSLSCYLFQLESQLGGDYSRLPKVVYGATSTHSIMSYFKNVELNIFTFLEGERNVDKPIHKNFKELKEGNVERAIDLMRMELEKYLR
jgi:hypothetical protein